MTQTSQLSLFWCETQAFGPNLTLSLQTPQISLFLVSSLTLLTLLQFLTSPGLKLRKMATQLLICVLFIVKLTDFSNKIWQLCNIAFLSENVLYKWSHISCCIFFSFPLKWLDSMLTLACHKACLTPHWPISLQIYAGLTILGTIRLRGLAMCALFHLSLKITIYSQTDL